MEGEEGKCDKPDHGCEIFVYVKEASLVRLSLEKILKIKQ